jgi:hypothetical protein
VTRSMKTFRPSQPYRQETIVAPDGSVFGTIRLWPSAIAWRPKNGKKFLKVRIEEFVKWLQEVPRGGGSPRRGRAGVSEGRLARG